MSNTLYRKLDIDSFKLSILSTKLVTDTQYEQLLEDLAQVVVKHKVRLHIVEVNYSLLPNTPVEQLEIKL